jgi:hypothetical protein
MMLIDQVQKQITHRLDLICHTEWKRANTLPNGKLRKRPARFSYSQAVHDLLSLQQGMLSGTITPEATAATLATGEINHSFELARKQLNQN